MMKLITFFVLVVSSVGFFLLSGSLHAQSLNPNIHISQYLHKSFVRDDRIKSVLDITQDDDGFLWLATYTGLVRFDGEEFVHYSRLNREDFSASAVRSLLKDRKGRLWIGTNDNGLFYYENGQFTGFTVQDGLPSNSVRILFEDRDGGLWVGTTSGLAYFDGTDFHLFSSLDVSGSTLVNFICQDEDGVIWVGMKQACAVYFLDKETKKFIPYSGSLLEVIRNAVLEFMIKDREQGGLWAITADKLIYVKDHEILQVYDLNQEIKYSRKVSNSKVYQDNNGALWLTGDSGLTRFYKGKFDFFTNTDGLSDDIVFTAYQDQEGNLWVGTRPGIDQFSETKFLSYSSSEGMLGDTVNAVLEDRPGEFLVATNQGLSVIHPLLNTVEKFSEQRLRTRIRHLYKDSLDRVWVSTYGNGLLVLKDREIIQQFTVQNGLAANSVRLVLEDRQHNIWVGTTSGLSVINPQGKITNYTTSTTAELSNGFILSLYEDQQGRLWIGTDGGGIYIYEKGRIIKRYSRKDQLSGNVIFRFYQDSQEGGIWVTSNNGISILREDKVYTITSRQGLLADSVFEIAADTKDRLWMTSNLGIFYVHRKDFEDVLEGKADSFPITVFDKHSGFKENPTATAWMATDADGKMWIPTHGGVAVVDPDNIPINEISPKTIILSSNINTVGKKKADGVLYIPPGVTRVNFYFAVLSFVSPEKNLLQFKLDGFDKDWSEPSKKREVSYTNLPPGAYSFKVKGMNNDGVSSSDEAVLRFYRTPYYYETSWFRFLVIIFSVILVALAGFLLYRHRVKRLNEELKRKKLQLELERKSTEMERLAKENEIRLSEAYSRFVPHIFFNFLGKDSVLDVGLGDQVEKELTVLFADIRDFTTLSENHSPKETFDFINSYLSQMGPIVYASEGFVDKYIGDAIMALFPSAQQALYAAIQMNLSLLNERTQGRIKNHQMPVRIGIGINTGNLMLGTVGQKNRMDGTVISDAVNLAARLESLTSYYGVNILLSEETYRGLAHPEQYQVRLLDNVTVKGKKKSVRIFEALDGLPEPVRAAKIRSAPVFEEAICHYCAGNLVRAQEIFRECLQKCPEDKTSDIYLQRCAHYLDVGIEKDWDGVSSFKFK
ncbi:MAG: two-component regulator propeller domain-containing protein [Candidatus Electrothrix aestuarii]|uniref:Two-component regulator propeller domain-containing protein n=1 Tax=Candidatus Electrothrix aestuarii TaxID=3062594 RepID=A0AAU8LQE5_9BACT|nr:two-component regulator propeller domain-containing protein [Candidatus Electrothrix aestuarii]